MSRNFPSVCIVGFGAFGQLVARVLSPYASLSVVEPCDERRRAAVSMGLPVIEPCELDADIVIVAVPVPAMANCLSAIAPHLRAGQLVADVCSIKEEPARLMRDMLPDDVEVLATHPMFGPVSAHDGTQGHQIVLCPVRGERWRALVPFFETELGLKVFVTTPEDHDRQAALTQGLTHLLARAFQLMGPAPDIETLSSQRLMDAFAMVKDDAPEVFDAVTRGNRHVKAACTNLIAALTALTEDDPSAQLAERHA